jgi:hypothetical protein
MVVEDIIAEDNISEDNNVLISGYIIVLRNEDIIDFRNEDSVPFF